MVKAIVDAQASVKAHPPSVRPRPRLVQQGAREALRAQSGRSSTRTSSRRRSPPPSHAEALGFTLPRKASCRPGKGPPEGLLGREAWGVALPRVSPSPTQRTALARKASWSAEGSGDKGWGLAGLHFSPS